MALPMKAMKKAAAMKGMKKAMKKTMKKSMKKKATKKKSMKKAKRVSKIARGKQARRQVFSGKKEKTATGMSAANLVKNKLGKIVSKKQSARMKKQYATSGFKKWIDACKLARKQLGIKGFAPVGGKTAQGKALYAKVKALL